MLRVARARRSLLSAHDQCDARKVDGSRVMRKELGERAGSQSRRPNGVGVARCAQREGDRQLVGADRLRAVPVIPAAEVLAQTVVDDLAQLLQSVQNLPGCVCESSRPRR